MSSHACLPRAFFQVTAATKGVFLRDGQLVSSHHVYEYDSSTAMLKAKEAAERRKDEHLGKPWFQGDISREVRRINFMHATCT